MKPNTRRSHELHNKARALLQQNRLSDALTAASEACKQDPGSVDAWFTLAAVYAQQLDYRGIADCCRNVIKQQPNNATAYFNLGLSLQSTGALQAAADAYRRAIALQANYAAAQINLASALIQLDQPQRSADNRGSGAQNFTDHARSSQYQGQCAVEARPGTDRPRTGSKHRASPRVLRHNCYTISHDAIWLSAITNTPAICSHKSLRRHRAMLPPGRNWDISPENWKFSQRRFNTSNRQPVYSRTARTVSTWRTVYTRQNARNRRADSIMNSWNRRLTIPLSITISGATLRKHRQG